MFKAFIQDFIVKPHAQGIDAFKELKAKNTISPDVFIVSSSVPEIYGFYSTAAGLSHQFGLGNAFAFDIKHGCNGGNLALKIGKDFLRQENVNEVLIIVDDQLSQYVDRSDSSLGPFFSWGNGASAILLNKKEGPFEILDYVALSDTRFAENVILKSGDSSITLQTNDEIESEIGKIYRVNYLDVIRKATESSGLKVSDLKALCMNQGDWKLSNHLQRETNIPWIQKTHEEFGHLGGSDIFLGLKKLQEENNLNSEDTLVLASSALGYSWSAQVLRKV